jgi:hypothetical protein
MNYLTKGLAVIILVVTATIKTFSVPSYNDTFSRAYGFFSPTDANQATNTFNDDWPKKSQRPDTESSTTVANALLDLDHHLLRHDDVSSLGATKIEADNNAGT